ncbi:uncharacterized protein LOC134682973 [Mytilus trossulus]|uniref:uncharacterized protein LOC134682973 n=1 Tax=Mytilus trossulus TaxID=6551 RepID=UPI0030072B1F
MLFVLLVQAAVQLTIRAQGNLTSYGKASQSTLFGGSNPQGAILPPITNNYTVASCSTTNTAGAPKNAWWRFQFSFEFTFITEITIYYRKNYDYRMDGFKLYVTNTTTIPPVGYLCYEDSDPGLPNITQNIPCNQLGKYVIYYDDKGDVETNTGPVVELCYVEIIGCEKGMWETNCSESCSSVCIDQHCHPGNGSCVWGCDEQQCLNKKWDKQTGVCTEGCVNETSRICNCTNCTSVF